MPFWYVIVVIATDVILYLLSVLDALKVIQCITLVSFFSEISIGSFWSWKLHFFTFEETVRSHLKINSMLMRFTNIFYISGTTKIKITSSRFFTHFQSQSRYFSKSQLQIQASDPVLLSLSPIQFLSLSPLKPIHG